MVMSSGGPVGRKTGPIKWYNGDVRMEADRLGCPKRNFSGEARINGSSGWDVGAVVLLERRRVRGMTATIQEEPNHCSEAHRIHRDIVDQTLNG